jgi:phage tail protein X
VGDIINVLVRDQDGWTQGVITNVIAANNRPSKGW